MHCSQVHHLSWRETTQPGEETVPLTTKRDEVGRDGGDVFHPFLMVGTRLIKFNLSKFLGCLNTPQVNKNPSYDRNQLLQNKDELSPCFFWTLQNMVTFILGHSTTLFINIMIAID